MDSTRTYPGSRLPSFRASRPLRRVRRPFIALALCASLVLGLGLARAGSGFLDPSWDGDGITSSSVGGAFFSDSSGIAVQADGRVIVAGAGGGEPVVVRFLTDGSLDPSFAGGQGFTRGLPPGAAQASANAIAAQPDGRIVVAGYVSDTGAFGEGDVLVARYSSDGTLDPSFGIGGVAPPIFGQAESAGAAHVVIQPDGRILVGGNYCRDIFTADCDHFFVRLLADGNLDPSFGTGGIVSLNLGTTYDGVRRLALQADGKVLGIGGRYGGPSGFELLVFRLDTEGSLDASFGVGGIAAISNMDSPAGLAIQADGKILASSWSYFVARLLGDGTLDATFGVGGVARPAGQISTGGGGDYTADVLLEADGGIVAVGHTFHGGRAQPTLTRYLPTGVLDASFGTNGVLVARPLGSAIEVAGNAGAIQADGRILITGTAYIPPGGKLSVTRILLASCGDGVVELGEQCDPGGGPPDPCCTATCQHAASGTACPDDGSTCTADTCNATGICVHTSAPRTGCVRPTRSRAARLSIFNGSGGTRDSLRFRWSRGDSLAINGLGNPLVDDDYSLCVFGEGAPTPTRLVDAVAPGGGVCANGPCWQLSTDLSGFVYRDPGQTPDGITSITILPGSSGRSRATVRASGSYLQLPSLPANPPLRVQLGVEGGACIEATFSAVRRNTSSRLVATSD